MNEPPVLRISELTEHIRAILEGSFPAVILEGEISNCRPSSTGHLYFTLKDETAAISAVMFKGRSRFLTFTPRDGMLVRVSGAVSVYAQRGTYQIIAETMEEAGTGDILRMLEERKRRLAEEGLFDSGRKRKLPFFPKTIGVITSPTGAAVRDIIQIIRRRNPAVSVIVCPAPVQGEEAAAILVRQLRIANRFNLADVLIIGRGGGSLEDMLPFSDEQLVRAIAASDIPVISAVGHEIDWALSDFVADVRAPTPSAAAELAVPLLDEIYDAIETDSSLLEREIRYKIERMRLTLRSFTPESMELRFRKIAQPTLLRFDDAKEALLGGFSEHIRQMRNRIALLTATLEGGSPRRILARGYAMVRDAVTGKIIRAAGDTEPGTSIEIIPAEGRITAQVTTIDGD
ncbi:MAG: exodeoxyribonuclease VII large subunit [Spirochaetaceae bacterium]|jgi:exodeoxyribonuclease VII large subunit|nr:exodeoxyribonuclease VII large subunit [Spirochaetaceae bacterium]